MQGKAGQCRQRKARSVGTALSHSVVLHLLLVGCFLQQVLPVSTTIWLLQNTRKYRRQYNDENWRKGHKRDPEVLTICVILVISETLGFLSLHRCASIFPPPPILFYIVLGETVEKGSSTTFAQFTKNSTSALQWYWKVSCKEETEGTLNSSVVLKIPKYCSNFSSSGAFLQ